MRRAGQLRTRAPRTKDLREVCAVDGAIVICIGAGATQHGASHRRYGERRNPEFTLKFWVRPPIQDVPCEQAPRVRATLAGVLLTHAVARCLQDAVTPCDLERTPRRRLYLSGRLRDFRGSYARSMTCRAAPE